MCTSHNTAYLRTYVCTFMYYAALVLYMNVYYA